jgi:hypothetical protein
MIVEQKAAQLDASSADESSPATGTAPSHRVETAAAIYDNGKVYLKSNPLKTTTEIRCRKCGLPRLLHPTDGNGARKPEPGVEYCKKRPFIDKPYHDVYGQTYVPEGPGRGKKKKDMVNPLKPPTSKEDTPSGSQDSPASPPPGEGPAKPISFPHAKCHNCNTFLPIKRMNNHMAKCIGGGGRDSSRTALWKIQNGNTNGSQNGSTTSPGSRNSTPIPNSAKARSSPNKRDPGDDFDSDSSPHKKKKIMKKTTVTKLKVPNIAKSNSASNLSFEEKAPNSEDDDDDDDGDGEYGTVVVEPKKKNKPVVKKVKEAEKKKKWLHGKGGVKAALPPVEPPDAAKAKKNGKGDRDADSESSQTLSSPN